MKEHLTPAWTLWVFRNRTVPCAVAGCCRTGWAAAAAFALYPPLSLAHAYLSISEYQVKINNIQLIFITKDGSPVEYSNFNFGGK